jgi:predicted nucleotidyltransferase
MKQLELWLAGVPAALRSLYGDNLLGVAVYGSAATGEYLPSVSDVNLVLILKRVELADLERMRGFRRRQRGLRLPVPLLLTPEHIRTSADVFPIEFLEIKEKHLHLWGLDPFSRLRISLANLRHECEHELKGRLLRLRQTYLEAGTGAGPLRQLLLAAHNANYPALRAALRLKRVAPPVTKAEVNAALSKHFRVEPSVLRRLQDLRENRIRLNRKELEALCQHYLNEVSRIASQVDRI